MDKYEKIFEEAKKAYLEANGKLDSIEDKSSSAALLLSGSISSLGYLFPELKEESDDERVRKALIKYFKENNSCLIDTTVEEVVAWLEKQGEQKSSWSEEDEEFLRHCCIAIKIADYGTFEERAKNVSWLRSLRPSSKARRNE